MFICLRRSHTSCLTAFHIAYTGVLSHKLRSLAIARQQLVAIPMIGASVARWNATRVRVFVANGANHNASDVPPSRALDAPLLALNAVIRYVTHVPSFVKYATTRGVRIAWSHAPFVERQRHNVQTAS